MITNSQNSTCINLSTTFTSANTELSPKSNPEKSISHKKGILSPNMFHRKNIKCEPVVELSIDEEMSPQIPKKMAKSLNPKSKNRY